MQRILNGLTAVLIATSLAAAPIVLGAMSLALSADMALAKNGNGNGGGNGHGNGNAGGNGKGGASSKGGAAGKGGNSKGGNGKGGNASASGYGAGHGKGLGGPGRGYGRAKGGRDSFAYGGKAGHSSKGHRGNRGSVARASFSSTDGTHKGKSSRPGKSGYRNFGAIASNLKGLNAAHAHPNARANAAPNSQVGRIATYEQATIGVEELAYALHDLEGMVDDTVPSSEEFVAENITEDALATPEEISGAMDSLDPQDPNYDAQVAAISVAITGLDPTDEDNSDALSDMAASIDATVSAQNEQADLAEEIAETEAALADQRDEQVDALAAAYAPHDVEDLQPESLVAMHDMLGLSPLSIPDLSEPEVQPLD